MLIRTELYAVICVVDWIMEMAAETLGAKNTVEAKGFMTEQEAVLAAQEDELQEDFHYIGGV